MMHFTAIRVSAILVHDGNVLLGQHRGHNFWILPGGKLHYGESLTDCAKREFAEETGFVISVERPVFIGDFITPDEHVLDVAFDARLDGASRSLSVPIITNDSSLRVVEWVPLSLLPHRALRPKPLWDFLFSVNFLPGDQCQYGGTYGVNTPARS
jgi:8-oxo-dGTP diphosphatase